MLDAENHFLPEWFYEPIYVNGYEYKNGEWKRTLAALWHLWF